MPIKLMEYEKYNIFYKDENGQLHEFGVPRYLNDVYFSCDVKRTNKKLQKVIKHWLNCLSRRNRRAKRIKEQERRSMLKWEALHNDGE